jgi:hypothetical protein
MHVEIFRKDYSSDGVYGVLLIEGKPFCSTLELPDKHNLRRQSCIPLGKYKCIRYSSEKFKNTFIILNVPGRSYILFHAGNIIEDSLGCILLGETEGKLRGHRAILNSGATFNAFLEKLKDIHSFDLTISNTITSMEQEGIAA